MKIIVLILVLYTTTVWAKTKEMVYIYNAPESNLDVRYNYQWEILRTALEKTEKEFGPFVLKPSAPMSEKRQVIEMKEQNHTLTVMYLDTSPDLEKSLIPIRIPVDKNLIGYRVFLVHKDNKDILKNVKKLEDLKAFSFGLGYGWIDIDIYESNGLKVLSAPNYELLFDMLKEKRFQLFSRGVTEILDEQKQRKATHPDLAIEENVLLYCPQPMYFWFTNDSIGKSLAKRAEKGMRLMMKDGSYDQIFEKHFTSSIETLKLKKRTLIKLKNPFLVSKTPLNQKELWFSP